jgi:hypothetical protein
MDKGTRLQGLDARSPLKYEKNGNKKEIVSPGWDSYCG